MAANGVAFENDVDLNEYSDLAGPIKSYLYAAFHIRRVAILGDSIAQVRSRRKALTWAAAWVW